MAVDSKAAIRLLRRMLITAGLSEDEADHFMQRLRAELPAETTADDAARSQFYEILAHAFAKQVESKKAKPHLIAHTAAEVAHDIKEVVLGIAGAAIYDKRNELLSAVSRAVHILTGEPTNPDPESQLRCLIDGLPKRGDPRRDVADVMKLSGLIIEREKAQKVCPILNLYCQLISNENVEGWKILGAMSDALNENLDSADRQVDAISRAMRLGELKHDLIRLLDARKIPSHFIKVTANWAIFLGHLFEQILGRHINLRPYTPEFYELMHRLRTNDRKANGWVVVTVALSIIRFDEKTAQKLNSLFGFRLACLQFPSAVPYAIEGAITIIENARGQAHTQPKPGRRGSPRARQAHGAGYH